MMLANVFVDLADTIVKLFTSMFDALKVLLGKCADLVVGWFGMLWDGIKAAGDGAMSLMLQKMGALMPTLNVSAWQSTLDGINYVFPLSEFIVMGAAFFSLWLVVWGYRFAKSWAPTVSS